MESAPVMASPSSDERFWGKLRDRVDTILDQRHHPSSSSFLNGSELAAESSGKRFREDSLLLLRGLDSAAASLSHLTNSLHAAQQTLGDLAKPSLTSLQRGETQRAEEDDNGEPTAKRHCGPDKLHDEEQKESGHQEQQHQLIEPGNEASHSSSQDAKQVCVDVKKSANLKKAKNLAISMASKAASLARELKTTKSELYFMQERCSLLEEENRRLRDGAEKGVRLEEDDLVRLQMEALLAEKSRLANENANLTRENQCLHQLVEYHQLASQDPSSPIYEQVIDGVCLDFLTPVGKLDDDSEDEKDSNGSRLASMPSANKLALASPLEEKNCDSGEGKQD